MNYIYMAALFAGGCWTGYLLGQFSSIKEMNRRLNALVAKNNALEEVIEEQGGVIEYSSGQIKRLSDLVAKYQSKQPEREANGKFASKKKRVLKELQDYVASK